MKMFDIIKSANQNLMRNKARSILTMVAIFVGSFVIILNTAISTGINNFFDDQITSIGGEGYIQFSSTAAMEATSSAASSIVGGEPQEFDPSKSLSTAIYITDEQIEKVKQIEGVKVDTLRTFASASVDYITSEKTDKKYVLATANVTPSASLKQEMLSGKLADPFSDDNQIAITQNLIKVLGFSSAEDAVGKKVYIGVLDLTTGNYEEVEATVTGVQANSIMSFGGPRMNWTTYNELHEISSRYLPETTRDAIIQGTFEYDYENYDIEELRTKFEEIGITIFTVDDMIGEFRTLINAVKVALDIFGYIALLAAAIGIINTLLMSVQERTREIGLDKALGMSSAKVFFSFSIEAISLGFWGSVFGIAISILIGSIANTLLHAEGGLLETLPTLHLVQFTFANIAQIVITIIIIAFIAGTIPALKAAKKNPIDSLRYE